MKNNKIYAVYAIVGVLILMLTLFTFKTKPIPTPSKATSSDKGEIVFPDRSIDLGQPPGYQPGPVANIPRIVAMLILVSLLALGTLYAFSGKLANFHKTGEKKGLIKIIEKQHITPQKSLYLIEVAGKHLLIGVTENSISILSELEDGAIPESVVEETQSTQKPQFSFQDLLTVAFTKKWPEERK